MKNLKSLYILTLIIGLFSITACNDDDVVIPNEEEVINQLSFTLSPEIQQESVIFLFSDFDGDGGNPPQILSNPLEANTSYTGYIGLLNTSIDTSLNITLDIEAEKEEHQLFFSTSNIDLSIEYLDFDENNRPVGLITSVTTGATGSGSLTITLRHQPDKSAEGVLNGDITNAGGETDIEVTFPVEIQ